LGRWQGGQRREASCGCATTWRSWGPSRIRERLYHQFGFSAHGFQLGPGAVMAELIVHGGTQTQIGGLSIERFA
jgi:glycine/D-amino acid oxidase-like deaminating enzyme